MVVMFGWFCGEFLVNLSFACRRNNLCILVNVVFEKL